MNRVYLDYNATTPVDPAVLDAMLPYLRDHFGNASSIHTFGQKSRSAIETAREQVAALIGAKPTEIIFTSGGTESDNHAIFGIISESFTSSTSSTSSPHLITSVIEHEAVLNACQELERRGAAVTYLPVDAHGLISLADLRAAIRPTTKLITVMHANNELGTVQPLAAIGAIAAEHKIPFHTDAVQSAGKLPINVNDLHVDLLSLSAHKLYGPKGVGALYIRERTKLRQFLFGGHHQRGHRPGTENVPAIVGLGHAAALAHQSFADDAQRLSALRDQLEQGILAAVPHSRVNAPSATSGEAASAAQPRANTDASVSLVSASRTPNTTNIQFPGIEGESLLIALDLKGLACSTGAACSSGAVEPSHVLTAIGLSADDARASLRFSLGRPTSQAEITRALEIIPAAVAQLRALSPTYRPTADVTREAAR